MTTPAAAWVDERLGAVGRRRTGDLEEVRSRPWGAVFRADTDHGAAFLKVPAPATAFEVPLYGLLTRVVPDCVLQPIAADVDAGWLLLPDGGAVLGEQHEGGALVDRLADVVPHYAQMQIDLTPHADELLALGVADMRPTRMLERFDEAVGVATALVRDRPDKAQALERVISQRDRLDDGCRQLAESPGAATLDHNDLHGGNVFLADRQPRFFDWGDAVVAHPFASALVLRSVVRWLLDAHAETPAERRVLDAYLEPFTALAPRPELLASLEVACEVGKVARSLVWARAVAPLAPEADDPDDFRSAPLEWLLELLA